MTTLDHMIIRVNDADETARFLERVLGFGPEGRDGPFTVMRVNASTTLLLAPWGTQGNEHYAFGLDQAAFDAAFARIRGEGIAYGDSFHTVGSNSGPGRELGARGMASTIYFLDPNKHLLEIRVVDV